MEKCKYEIILESYRSLIDAQKNLLDVLEKEAIENEKEIESLKNALRSTQSSFRLLGL